ncbi:MAG: carboxypeptidase M32, partial [Chthonomonadales bacterium]
MNAEMTALEERIAKIRNLNRIGSVIDWDMQTQMPSGGFGARSEQMATLTEISHELFVADETRKVLEAAESSNPQGEHDARSLEI